jgi:predicted transglutaminase-like cysteine proteinase
VESLVNKHLKLSFFALVFAGAFGIAEPAVAFDRVAMISQDELSATAYDQPARALFGMETEPSTGELSSKWHAVEAEIEQEATVLARCRTEQACPAPAQDLLDLAAEGAGRTGLARVGLINRAVNLAIRPTTDQAQWGVADRWSPPFETLNTRRGDCEDYAILKYAALLEAGLSRDDLKIVVLRDFIRNEDHAVLAARVDGEWRILDNRNLVLVRAAQLVGAHPIFVLDPAGAHRLVSEQDHPNRAR